MRKKCPGFVIDEVNRRQGKIRLIVPGTELNTVSTAVLNPALFSTHPATVANAFTDPAHQCGDSSTGEV